MLADRPVAAGTGRGAASPAYYVALAPRIVAAFVECWPVISPALRTVRRALLRDIAYVECLRSTGGRIAELVGEAGRQDSRITPHRFRAWFATHLLEGTGDLALVQDAPGHADPATTRAYTTVSSRRLREAHRRVFDGGEAAGA